MDYLIFFPIIKIFAITTISFILAFCLTPVLTHFLYKYKVGKPIRSVSQAPVFSKLHQKKEGTPTMGGILVWVSVVVVFFMFFYINKIFPQSFFGKLNFWSRGETLLPMGALVASSLIGLIDDIMNIRGKGIFKGGLKVWHRLFIYTAVAIGGSYWFFYKLGWDVFRVPFVGNFEVGFWYVPIFIFIIVATAFSVNEADGLDGLAGGMLLAAFASFGAMSFVAGKYDLAAFCGAISGALLAFLWFNINPARFFMGDTGAMGMGVTLAVVAMLTNTALFLPVIGFLFVIESASVIAQILSKKIFKKKIFISSPIHHHLEAIGWSEPKIVMRFWVVSGVMSVVGLILFLIDRSY